MNCPSLFPIFALVCFFQGASLTALLCATGDDEDEDNGGDEFEDPDFDPLVCTTSF